jgi:hypothetical protein
MRTVGLLPGAMRNSLRTVRTADDEAGGLRRHLRRRHADGKASKEGLHEKQVGRA